jgi:competence protein ComEC
MREWYRHQNWAIFIWLGVMLLLALNLYLFQIHTNKGSSLLEITVLDVGQGDSILIKSPDGLYALIDGGRGTAVMSQLDQFMPFWERKFSFIIATHPDADHIEGLIDVLDQYEVEQILWVKNKKKTEVTYELEAEIQENKVLSYELNSERDFRLGCCIEFDVVWPSGDFDSYDEDEANAASLTVILRYGKLDMFLGGDLYVAQEEQVAGSLPLELRQIDVLKVSHHGSKTSTSAKFLHLIDTQIGLISAGKRNSYGHPAAEVLQNLENENIEIIRTDLEGTIQLKTDGEQLEIKTHNRLEYLDLKD